MLGVSGLACFLAFGCGPPLSARREGPAEITPAPTIARVDLERVRRESKLDGVDAELTIRLLAHAVAEVQGLAELVDETTPSPSAAVDITDAVLAALARDPVAMLPWLVGTWQGESNGATTTEHWCPAADGTLHGYNATVQGGEQVAFEWLGIALQPVGLVYLAQPQGATPGTPFAETADETPNAARFENPDNEFPKRLQYTRDGHSLHVAATGGEQRLDFTWRRLGGEGFLEQRAQVAAAAPAIAKACAAIRARTPP